MARSAPDDRWTAGEAYETFMGRWSRQLAEEFVRWLEPEAGCSWLDIGCGTGALTAAICHLANPLQVITCSPSEPLARHAEANTSDPRVSVVIAAAGHLPEIPGGFDQVVSGLVLNFLPDLVAFLREMRGGSRSGGTVAAYGWDYSGRTDFLRLFWDEASGFDPSARELDEGARFPMCALEPLRQLFRDAGLEDIACEGLEIPSQSATFEDYWKPFLGGTGPAPAYAVSLDTERRAELRARLVERLAPSRGGSIDLMARAWAVRGTVP